MSNIDWKDYIQSTPDTLSGKPRFKGTRISVEFILDRLATGWSYADVLASYPALTLESIQAALAFVTEIFREEAFIYKNHAVTA